MGKRKIVWSHRANIRLFSILDFYAARNKSTSYSKKLYKRFIKELTLLCKQPELGIITETDSVRALIVSDFIIFYEVTDNAIIVHSVWDCKQNPSNLHIK